MTDERAGGSPCCGGRVIQQPEASQQIRAAELGVQLAWIRGTHHFNALDRRRRGAGVGEDQFIDQMQFAIRSGNRLSLMSQSGRDEGGQFILGTSGKRGA